MSNQETKRQHFVPKTYLNKFAFERKPGEFQIHSLRKPNLSKSFPVSTSKICVENDMYTLEGQNENERQLIERIYGDEFESQYDDLFNLLTNDSIITISNELKERIIGKAISLLFRTKKIPNANNHLIERVIDRSFYFAEKAKAKHINFEGLKIDVTAQSSEDLIKEIKKQGKDSINLRQLEFIFKLIEIRKNDSIGIVKLESEDNYLTSDNPVSLYKPGGSGIIAPFDPSNVMSLLLNNKYKLDIYPPGMLPESDCIARISHEGIFATGDACINNFKQVNNSDSFILGDKSTLNNLEEMMQDEDLASRLDQAYKNSGL